MRVYQLKEQFEAENNRLKRELEKTKDDLKTTRQELAEAKAQLTDVRARYLIHKLSQNRHRLLTNPGADE